MKVFQLWKHIAYIIFLFCVAPSHSYSMNPELIYMKKSVNTKPRVAIIGAGLAGLTMAHRLKAKGYSVCVFEAKNRVGGRVHSVYVKNAHGQYSLAELGGHNITDGGKAPHFHRLAHEFKLEIEEDPRHLTRGFYFEKKLHNPNQLLKELVFSQNRVSPVVNSLQPDATIEDVISKLFAESPVLQGAFSYYVGSYEGLPCSQLPLVHNLDTLTYFLPGGGAASPNSEEEEPFLLKHIQGGNSLLPQTIAASLKDNVFLNKPLKKVFQGNGKEIRLEFADSSVEQFDKLILANPCSTFQNIQWENSVIPSERLQILLQVEYGQNGKLIIPNSLKAETVKPLYHSVFSAHFGFLENSDYSLLVGFSDGVLGPVLHSSMQANYPSMLELAEANYGPIQVSNDLPALAVEEHFTKYDTPVVKSWAEDPYAKGSYATVGVKLKEKFLETTTINDIPLKSIFTPIDERVYFIGEHTSIIDEVGTMEAAIESAERLSQLFD